MNDLEAATGQTVHASFGPATLITQVTSFTFEQELDPEGNTISLAGTITTDVFEQPLILTAQAVPEPASVVLFGAGLICLCVAVRRKMK